MACKGEIPNSMPFLNEVNIWVVFGLLEVWDLKRKLDNPRYVNLTNNYDQIWSWSKVLQEKGHVIVLEFCYANIQYVLAPYVINPFN